MARRQRRGDLTWFLGGMQEAKSKRHARSAKNELGNLNESMITPHCGRIAPHGVSGPVQSPSDFGERRSTFLSNQSTLYTETLEEHQQGL